jgi:hypothetical protein
MRALLGRNIRSLEIRSRNGNPARVMRLAQAWSYETGERCSGDCGGKVEGDGRLIAPCRVLGKEIGIV